MEDALDVREREKSAERVAVANDEQFMNAHVGGEKTVGSSDGIGAEFALVDGLHLRARHHGVSDFLRSVALADDVAGEQTEEFVFGIHDRERAEAEAPRLDHFKHLADEQVGADFDGVLNQSVDVVFHP